MVIVYIVIDLFAVYGLFNLISKVRRYTARQAMYRRIDEARANCCSGEDHCTAIKPVVNITYSGSRKRVPKM